MEAKLMQDFPKDAEMIMASISGVGLLINRGEDIDYNNCHRYQEVEEKSKRGVVGECEYIAGLRKEAELNREKLKSELVRASLGPIRGIYTREVATPIVKSRLVDPILGEGLREGVKHLKKAFKDSWEKREGRIEEQEKYRARMKGQLDGITKGEQGKYKYVAGAPKNILPEYLRDIREVNTGDKPNADFKDSTNVETNSNTDNKKVFKSIKVAKDHTVWGIYGNKPTQKQLEEFIKNNPYIAARGVVRDGNGNIKHLEIRAGEEITVPTNIADAYNNEFTPIVKESSGDSKYIQDICFDPNAGDKYGNIFGAQDAMLKCVDGVCPTNTYTATLNIDNIVESSTKINKVTDVQNIQSKPTIEFFVRDVKYTGEQHGYTIFTYSDGTQIIITGFPENMNMLTGNLKGVIIDYTDNNYDRKLFPEGDWKDNKSRKLIQKWEIPNDQKLKSYLSQAKQAIDFVNTGNNGERFDYDFCKTDACSGANSNTVQKLLFEKMNLNLDIPKDVSLAGIKGKFYDGPFDNYIQKLGTELQKEQP